jgi:hypothetical protein
VDTSIANDLGDFLIFSRKIARENWLVMGDPVSQISNLVSRVMYFSLVELAETFAGTFRY